MIMYSKSKKEEQNPIILQPSVKQAGVNMDMATTDRHTSPYPATQTGQHGVARTHTHQGSQAPACNLTLTLHYNYLRPLLHQFSVHLAMTTISCQMACSVQDIAGALDISTLLQEHFTVAR